MAAVLTLDDVRKSWDARDPRLITLIEQLCNQPVPAPETPVRDGAITFDKFLSQLRDPRYRKKTREEQAHYRIETLKALEAPNAEVPLADKLKVHEVIFALWESNDALARDYLLHIIARVPLVYGPWKAIKKIFKESEAKNDTEIFGAIAARLDMAQAGGSHGKQVSGATVAYCARRAWRYLRRVGLHLPATYPDVACEFLVNYTDNTTFRVQQNDDAAVIEFPARQFAVLDAQCRGELPHIAGFGSREGPGLGVNVALFRHRLEGSGIIPQRIKAHH